MPYTNFSLSRANSDREGASRMKNIPLYEVRKITDLRDMLTQSVMLYQDMTAFMIKKKRGMPYENVSFKQFGEDVESMGTALSNLLGLGSRVAILSESRYEWYVSYLSVTNGTGVIVPLDKELPPQEIAGLLNRSQADCLIYSVSKQGLIDSIQSEISSVKHFICMDAPTQADVLDFHTLLSEGRKLVTDGNRLFIDAPLDPEEMTVLLFTSGTTDRSKAVMLSQRNITANLEGMCAMTYIGPEDVFLSVLPLHHTYECTCGFLCQIYRGSTIAQCEGLRYIVPNMQESKATVILVVPLMLEMFQRAIM